MAKHKVIVVALAFFGFLVLGTGLIAQQKKGRGVDQAEGIDPKLKALMEARVQVAKEVFEATMAPPRTGSLDEILVWSRRWMEEQIQLDPAPIKKLTAIQDHLYRTRDLEAIAIARRDAARGTPAESLKVKYFRLEAEQMLAELRIINPALFPLKPPAKP